MLMKHRYACHILRTALLVLSGESMEEQKLKSKRSLKYNSNHQLSSSVSRVIFLSYCTVSDIAMHRSLKELEQFPNLS